MPKVLLNQKGGENMKKMNVFNGGAMFIMHCNTERRKRS
jgi:hypothetical protein